MGSSVQISKRWWKILLMIEVVYLLIANVAINSGAISSFLNKSVSDIEVTYRWGFSVLPGVFHFKDLGMRVQDHNVQLHFALREIRVTVNFLAMRKKEFHAWTVAGSGLQFRFRLKKLPHQMTATTLQEVPPIPGLDSILKGKRKLDEGGETWKVRLPSISIRDIQELWFEAYRYQGQASLQGGFYLWTGGKQLEIYETNIAFDGGEVHLAGKRLAQSIDIDLQAKIHFFEPEKMTPQTEHQIITQAISVRLKGKAEIASLAFLNYYLPRGGWLSFERGQGPVECDVGVEEGVLSPRSRLSIVAKDISVRTWNQEVTGDGRVELVPSPGKGSTLAVKLDNFFVQPKRPGVQGKIVGSGLELEATAENFDFAKINDTQPMRVELRIPKSKVTDLRLLNSFFPAGSQIRFRQGEAVIESRIVSFATGQRDSGFVRLRATDALADITDRRVRADLDLNAAFDQSQVSAGQINLKDTRVQVRRVTIADLQGKMPQSTWWANAAFARAELSLKDEVALRARVEIEAQDATPLIEILMPSKEDRATSIAENLLKFNRLKATVDAMLEEKTFTINDLYVAGERGYAKGWLKNLHDVRTGRFLVVVEPFAVGVEVKGKSTSVRLHDALNWYHSSIAPKVLQAE